MQLQKFLDLWLETYIKPKRAENTVRAYVFALAHLPEDLRSADLVAVEPLRVQMAINDLAAVYPRQAQLLYQALRSALTRAERLDMISRTPMDRVDPPTHEAKRAKTLTAAQAAAYFRAAEPFPLLRLMLALGLRRNEARGLKKGDFCEGVLSITRQRTRNGFSGLKSRSSRRELPVPEPLRGIFSGPGGELIQDVSESTLRRQHQKVCMAIGVEGVTLHGLRHTAATLAAAEDVPISTIQHLLGHKHIALTADLYVHADLRALDRCTRILYNNFGPSRGVGARLEIV